LFPICHIYIYKRLCPRKKIRNRKKERAATEKKKEQQEQFFKMKLNTKPLKFKCGLAEGEGGPGGGLVDPCKAWVPPPSS
jgi:hypothetical protein